jgi:hypothetical protein
MSSTEARLPSLVTLVVESTLRVLSLPESVSVLLARSKLCTRPCSAVELELMPDPVDDEAVEPALSLEEVPLLLLPVELSEPVLGLELLP